MGKHTCPNVESKEWKSLLNELNNNRLLAIQAFNKNDGEIPDINSEIVQKLKPKSKLKFGPAIKTVQKDEFSEEDFYETDNGDKINRVGSFIKFFSSSKVRGKDFIQEKADHLWEGKDKETYKIANGEGIAESYEEYISRRREWAKISAAKGKVLHLAIEMVLNPNIREENLNKIKSIVKEMKDETGNPSFHWEWILNSKEEDDGKGEPKLRFTNIEKIFDNLGLNYFKDTGDAFNDLMKDRIMTEVSVAVPEINLGGKLDMLVEHSDGTFSIVDWKTGKNFSGRPELEDLFLMKYGDQGTKEITDNFRNRAKIQLAMYAILLKANNPGMKFRDLQIGWIPNEYIIQNRDVNAAVDVASVIPMIEQLMSDKKFLKENGIDENMKAKLLKRDNNIFKISDYSQSTISQDIHSQIVVEGKSPQQVLSEKIAKLKYITMSTLRFESLSEEKKAEARRLSDEISQMMQEGNIVITDDTYHDMNLMERHLGNYSEVNHPLVMSWKAFKNDREQKANLSAIAKKNKFRSLLRPVLKEIDNEFNVLNVAGNKSYNYDEVYGWMYVGVNDNDDTGKSRERLLTAKETDPELKEKWRKLSPAKKRLLTFINKTFSEYFVGEEAFMNQQATFDVHGNPISQLELFNKKKSKLDQRGYYDGFFFKLPITDEEILTRAGSGSYLKGAFSKDAIGKMLYNASTMFKEREYENWFSETNAIPVKYLGNEYIDTSQNYTHNMEFIFDKAITEMERTIQMQDVYAMGTAIKNKLEMEKDPNNPYEPLYKNLIGFLDAKLINDVQKKTKPIRWLNSRKVRLPMYNIKSGKTEMYPISMDKLVFALRSWGSMVTMWARPFRGTGNGIQATLLTHREGIKGSISKLKFLGINGEAIDFTGKDIAKADAMYVTDFGPHMLGDVRKSKMYLMAKKLDYFGNNFEYHFLDRESLSKRNKKVGIDTVYLPYSIPEEEVTMTTMAAMLLHMKNKTTGKSIWDSYEKYEILDEKGNGTGEFDVRWTGGVRGTVKKGSGDAAIYEEMTELTAREIASMKKVHERLQGNYRREEALAMEVTSLGKMFMMLKRYYPRLLLNGLHKKRVETDLGTYKQVQDENGNFIMRNIDGKEMPIYEWHARVAEGRWLTLGKMLGNILTLGKLFKEHGWSKLTDEQRMNLIEATVVLGQWMVFYGLYLTWFGDTDDDDTTKRLWKQYLVDNLTQQYNFADLVRTAKSFGTPVAVSKMVDFVISGSNLLLAGANYGLGNDDLALTKDNDLKGWNKFAKGIPLLASYKDIIREFEKDKTGALSWSDWLNDGVKLQ